MPNVGPPADRGGSLSPLILSELLGRAADEKRTGALQVVSGPAVKSVHISRGSVRFAESNLRKDRLGATMLAHALISERDYEAASLKMKRDRCRFGEALLSMGRLTEKDLQRELGIQVQRIVLSLFRLERGMYSFEAQENGLSRAALPFGLSVPSLILKGLRSVRDGRVILSALPPAGERVRAAGAPPARFASQKLTSTERDVLARAGSAGTSVGAIARECRDGRSAALRSLFVLLTVGLLERLPGEKASRAPRPDRATPSMS